MQNNHTKENWQDHLRAGDSVCFISHKGRINATILNFNYKGPTLRVNLQGEDGLLYSNVKIEKLLPRG